MSQKRQDKGEENEEITIEENPEESFGGRDASEELKRLKEKLKKCEEEKNEYLTGWQRAKADFINARKEEEEKRSSFVKFSTQSVLLEFIQLADGFDRAMMNREAWEKVDKNWRQGVQHLYSQLMEILKSHGLSPVESIGKVFDPKEHQSVGEINVENDDEDGIVIEEVSKGYSLHGLIVRPAQVKVGKFLV